MFGFLKQKPPKKIGGMIGFFGLGDWWLNTLTDAERKQLGGDRLIERDIVDAITTRTKYFTGLANGCGNDSTPVLYRKLMDQAEAARNDDTDLFGTHFMLHSQTTIYRKNRDKWPGALEAFVRACREQVRISAGVTQAFKSDTPILPSKGALSDYVAYLQERGLQGELHTLIERAKKEGWPGKWS
jgi:hypothetical protein